MFYVRSNDGTRIAVYEFNKECSKTVFLVTGGLSHIRFMSTRSNC